MAAAEPRRRCPWSGQDERRPRGALARGTLAAGADACSGAEAHGPREALAASPAPQGLRGGARLDPRADHHRVDLLGREGRPQRRRNVAHRDRARHPRADQRRRAAALAELIPEAAQRLSGTQSRCASTEELARSRHPNSSPRLWIPAVHYASAGMTVVLYFDASAARIVS